MKKIIAITLALTLFLTCTMGANAALASGNEMSLRQQIWQKIMICVRQWSDTDPASDDERAALPDFTAMNEPVAAFLAEAQPGGFILFAQNTPDTETILRLTGDIQQAITGTGAPAALIGIDQEGGRVTRLKQGTSMPGSMAVGATGNVEYARATGQVLGEELRALGIHVDFAPSLDVNNNAANPVINVRSFGAEPETVSKMGVAMIEGLADSGVIAAAKHFPGHGNTSVDSHSALPLVDQPLDEILDTELAPFQAAVDADIQMIMTAHIQYPALDDTTVVAPLTGETIMLPATLSKKILTDTLRDKMGFDGVIITDAMNMAAIAANFTPGDTLIRAFEAGADIALMPISIMCPGDIAAMNAAVDEVEQAVMDGRLSAESIAESAARILALKERNDVTVDKCTLEKRIMGANQIIANADHRAIEREIADASVTLLKNDGVLPIAMSTGDTLLIIGAYSNECTAMRFGAERLIAEGKLPDVEIETFAYTKLTEFGDELPALLDKADAVVFDSEIGSIESLQAGKWQSDFTLALTRELNQRGLPYCAVSICLPEDTALLTDAKALLTIYNPAGMSDIAYSDTTRSYAYTPSLPAAMDVIFGAVAAQGHLPVPIYALTNERTLNLNEVLYPIGHGLVLGEAQN